MNSTTSYIKDLFDQPAMSAFADRQEIGITPSYLTLNGNEVVLNYVYTGRGAEIHFEAAWSFTWRRFYCLKTSTSDFFFSAPEPLLLTESEMLEELEEFHASADFELEIRETVISEEDFEYVWSRFEA